MKSQHRPTKECGRKINPYTFLAKVEKSVLIKGIRNVISYRLTQHRTRSCLSINSYDASYPKGVAKEEEIESPAFPAQTLPSCTIDSSLPTIIFSVILMCPSSLFTYCTTGFPLTPNPFSLTVVQSECYLPILNSFRLFNLPQRITFNPHSYSIINRRGRQGNSNTDTSNRCLTRS